MIGSEKSRRYLQITQLLGQFYQLPPKPPDFPFEVSLEPQPSQSWP